MKKLLIVALLVAMVGPVFADDALVLPNRVIRFRTIPAFTFVNQTFDADGERQDLSREIPLTGFGNATFGLDSVNIWALNFALEVGVTEQINIAAQWTPGWRFASTTNVSDDVPSEIAGALAANLINQPTATALQEGGTEALENAKLTGLDDLFVGAKIQILGPAGYIPNETMRLATSIGAKIPLSVYDPDEADEQAADGEEFQAGRVGRDVLALGARVHFDYIVSPMFFVNLFSETQIFLPRDLEGSNGTEQEFAYGYEQSFELDPQVTIPVSDGVNLSGSLATRFTFTPDVEVDGNTVEDSATQLLTVTPQVGAFFTSLPVPLEAKLQYGLPVYGVNAQAANTIALQLNTYLRF